MFMTIECPQCEGNGWIAVRRILIGTGPSQVFEEDCQKCKGAGCINVDCETGEQVEES